jgi:tetratricopeptide (TPR) repeat protein
MARLAVCVVVLVAASSPALAQHARYPRQQPVTAAAPGGTKPSIDADAVLSIDSLRGAVRTEQEQILADLITNTPDSEVEEKADYYFRLGELYANLQLTSRRSGQLDRAKNYLLKAVKVYKGLTDNEAFRNYPKLDVALFYYAYTLQSGKYLKEARQVYDKLLKNFPNSKYVPEAHVAFADYHFEQGQLADAEARYKHVLKFPKSSVYAYALYKLGWVQLQLARTKEAVEAFQQVVTATREDPKQAQLQQAARADLAVAAAANAEALWTLADREPDPKLRSERWTRAATAFATIQTAEVARATALAWMNAVDVVVPADTKVVLGKAPRSRPRVLPFKGNDAKLVAAIKTYAAQAPAADDELAQMRLALAAVLRGYRRFEEAATVLNEFLDQHADDARAEFAANLMLDSLMQGRMLDELVEVAAAMTADTEFVDGKPQLQQNLLVVRTRLLAKSR